MRIIITCFFVSLITVVAGCAGSANKSTVYKGGSKYIQPRLSVFPGSH